MRNSYRIPCLLAILLLAAWLRFPFLGAGLPYLYDEDEAHHHNRIVNMVKKGTFDPEYFHKPSLHFYFRMPFVALGFLSKTDGDTPPRLSSIRTQDNYGLWGYAFTTSSPHIVKWNRLCSFLLSLGVIAITFFLVFELYPSLWAASLAALLVSLSPDLVSRSATVAVDVPMTLLCLLSVLFALRAERRKSISQVLLSAVCAGLALSTKYNALPVLLVPLLASLALPSSKRTNAIFASLGISLGCFLLASPFILVHIPLFLNQLAYEKWHYGSAGHAGHSGEPGLSQALFYLRWLALSALGVFALFFSVFALGNKILRKDFRTLIFLCYPVLFFLYMSAQKVNFERNMISLIPFFALVSAIGALWFAQLLSRKIPSLPHAYLLPALTLLLLAQPTYRSFVERHAVRNFQDSREVFWQEVSQNGITQKTAIAGELWMRPEIYTLPFVVPFSQTKKSLEQLAQLGVEHLVVGNLENYEVFDRNFKLVKSFPGDTAVQRIVKNPELRLYAISEEYASLENLQKSVDENASYQVNVSKNKKGNLICTEGHVQHTDAEQHCWTRAKFMKFFTEGRTSLELASAWEGQEVKVFSTERKLLQSLRFEKPWDWKEVKLPTGTKAVYLETKMLQSPGMGDTRMLGVAVR